MKDHRVSWKAVILIEGTDIQHPTLMNLEAWAKAKGLKFYMPFQAEGPIVLQVNLAELEGIS